MNQHVAVTRSASRAPSVSTFAPLRSLLVPVDLTPVSDRVLARVAHLPLANDARVTLLHVVPGNRLPDEQDAAERDAHRTLFSEARHLAASLHRSVRVEPVVTCGSVPREIAAQASASSAELIVMGRAGGSALRDAFLGSTAERVVRKSKLPVLVVRQPVRAAYTRPALALDLDHAAHEIVPFMLRVLRSSSPYVHVIHAFDAPYQGLAYPTVSDLLVEERRHKLQLEASRDLSKLLATSLARANVAPEDAPFWKHQVHFGSPRAVIREAVQKSDADLLVLGTHGYTGVGHILLGTVAGDVLRDVASDVLIVPSRAARA